MEKCVLYLRSSKDRSEVSLDAQRRQLRELAASRNFVIVKEFEDAVESGKDDDRPGFQELIKEMRLGKKEWSIVLALDTSRISRRRMISIIFEEQECKRQGVRVVYKSLPDADPATEMILKSILQAMDEWHSLTSKAKGLAGMSENVKQGYRAGGRAPRGYKLDHKPTGAIRDGAPVMKSKLVPNEDEHQVRQYFKNRVSGMSRMRAAREAGLNLAATTLLDMDRNALTYAGHTVWNKRNENGNSVRFKDRSQWEIFRNTHEAYITDEEAEDLLRKIESKVQSKDFEASRVYILTGILFNKEGVRYHSDGVCAYRAAKGRRLNAVALEKAVLDKVMHDLTTDAYALAIFNHYQKQAVESKGSTAEINSITKRLSHLEANNLKLSSLLSETSAPDALLRAIETNETERLMLSDRLRDIKLRNEQDKSLKELSLPNVKTMLKNIAADFNEKEAEDIKILMRTIIEKIVIDEESLSVSITYRSKSGEVLASPRGFEHFPAFTWVSRPLKLLDLPVFQRWQQRALNRERLLKSQQSLAA